MGLGPVFLNKNCGKNLPLNFPNFNEDFGGTFGKTQFLDPSKFNTLSPTANQL